MVKTSPSKGSQLKPARNGEPDGPAPAPRPAFLGTQHAIAPDERAAAGKALREKVLRADQRKWTKEHRPDPIDLLQAADADRLQELVPIRYGRMLASPFAFYRGSAGVMASDLSRTPSTGIHVQACGDCHLMNFGGFATPERSVLFDINDFDETLPAPWEWDVKRLAASFVLAVRNNGMSDAKAQDAAYDCVRSYRKRIAEYAAMPPLDVWYARVTSDDLIATVPKSEQDRVRTRVAKAAKADSSEMEFPKMTDIVGGKLGIRDTPPLIFHPQETKLPEFAAVFESAMGTYRDTLTEDRRVLFDRYRLVDAAIKVVGVGSVGRRCWIGLFMSADNDPLFLQFKEAVASVMEPYAGASIYPQHGQRVVMGQRLMQPASDIFLGWFEVKETGKQFYGRQLRDAKIKPLVETFDDELMSVYAKGCGWVLARAHAKAGDAATITGYLGNSDEFDEAIAAFAVSYADQAERDYAALKAAVRKGRVTAFVEG